MTEEWGKIEEDKMAKIEPFLDEAPVKIVGMAKNLGLSVLESNLGRDKAGQIIADGGSESGYKIRVNRDDSYYQQRFAVAHEIAHYLIHEDKIGTGVHDTGMYR